MGLFFLHLTYLEVLHGIIQCIEETESTEDLDLETVVGKEIHEWEESEVWCECESTTWTSREDSSDSSTDSSDEWPMVEILMLTEEIALVIHPHDKKGETKNHHHREHDIDIRMSRSVVPKHDGNIGKIPPYSQTNYDKSYICEYSHFCREELFEVLKHMF